MRVGIVGYGIVGRRREEAIIDVSDVTLAAICDRNLVPGLRSDGVETFNDFRRLLDCELDAVFVCVTNDVAGEVTEAALLRGLHVFCEKPPANSLSSLKRVHTALKRSSNLRLMYGFNHRYHDSVIKAKELISSGKYGSIINMRGVYGKSSLITFDQDDWRTKRSIAGGGVLLDQGIHMVDLMRFFGGELECVKSIVSNSRWKFDVEDNAYALLQGRSGVVAMLNSSATEWRHRFSLELNLQQASINLTGLLTGSKSYGDETLCLVEPDFSGSLGPIETTTKYNQDLSWSREVDKFFQHIRGNVPVTECGFDDSFKTLQLVFSIYFSDEGWRHQYDCEDPNLFNLES